MRLRRIALMATVAGGVFAAVLALTFPTDAIVRGALARVTFPGSLAVVFERARLRPWGLRLDGVGLRRVDGSMLADVEWLTLRPSLVGFVRDRTGRPWRLTAGACAGRLTAVAERPGTGRLVSLDWRDVDLARCPPLAVLGDTVAGLATGTAVVRGAPPAAEGEIAIRRALWRGEARRVPGLEVVRADPVTVRWTLRDGRLTLTAIGIDGPEVRASGSGTVRLASALGRSTLDLRLTVAPGAEAPPGLRYLLARLPPGPDSGETRRLDVGGTIDAPRALVGS